MMVQKQWTSMHGEDIVVNLIYNCNGGLSNREESSEHAMLYDSMRITSQFH